MRFETNEMFIDILRDHYCFATPENGIYGNDSGTEVMVLFWAYSGPDGFCTMSNEHIFLEDIRKLNKGLEELESCTITEFEMEFPRYDVKMPLIRIKIRRGDDSYHLDLKIFDWIASEYLSFENTYTTEEWQIYVREFAEWGAELPVQLGAKARTNIHVDDDFFWLGREGRIVEVYPPEKSEDTLRVELTFTDYGWDKKPYRNGRLYDIDDINILLPGEELQQEDLNHDLFEACTAEQPDFIRIKRLLQQGAQPLGLIKRYNSDEYVYHAIIDEYNCWEEEHEIETFYRITELFLHYGMDFSKPVVPYDDWDLVHPLWSFTFFHTNAILKVLKLLLDNGMDAEATSECWNHDMLDLFLFPIHGDSDKDIHRYFEHELARLMLFASYPHVLDNDPSLQDEIWLRENDYDPQNFRDWKNFYFSVDSSQRPDPERLRGTAITIYERGTGKEVWKFLFDTHAPKHDLVLEDNNGGATIVYPAKLVPEADYLDRIQEPAPYPDFALSLEEENFASLITIFLENYFDRTLLPLYECRYIDEPGYDYYGNNLYTYESIRKMLAEIRDTAQALRDGRKTPIILELISQIKPKILRHTGKEMPNERLIVLYREEIADYYDRFCAAVQSVMDKAPEYEYLNFCGP